MENLKKALEQNKEEEELKSCTFQPTMYTKKTRPKTKASPARPQEEGKEADPAVLKESEDSGASRRTHQQFLDS
jgi:hypothetical protein